MCPIPDQKPDLDQTLKKIEGLLSEYMSIRNSCNITALLDVQDKIAIWGMRLAELSADYMTSYNYQYFIRKINVSKKKMQLIKLGNKIGASDAQAMVDNEEVMNVEQENESIAYKADLILKQLNKTLSSIQQRISFMKQEQKSVETYGGKTN